MCGVTALTCVLLFLSAQVYVHAKDLHSDDHEAGCTAFNEPSLTRVVNATTVDAQIILTASIIADILPDVSIGPGLVTIGVVPPGDSEVQPTNSTSPDSTLRNIYTVVAKHYDQSVTEGGYREFLEATNEISLAKEEACRNVSEITSMSLQLIQEFIDSYKMKDQSSHPIRSAYGKLLCLNSTINSGESRRKRRDSGGEECKCPPDGLDSDFTFCDFCDFYACLTDGVIKDIFFGSQFLVDYQCLAFVIDTTGSMSEEISIAKDVILNFVRSEQDIGDDGCYLLVEFNDVGPYHEIVPEDSVSNITYASSFDALQLSIFYNKVRNITAGVINNRLSSGGDGPEYALFAMKKALTAVDDDGYTLMITGSQMVVLTDAISKQPELKDKVIDYATNEGVCIHFFVNHDDYSLSDGIYQEIAEKTHGTLISSYSQWDIANFVAKYEDNGGCDFLIPRRKRSASLSSCKTATVSRLAANLRLSINAPTGSGLTIIQPSGVIHDLIVVRNDFILFNQTNPEHGSWRICSTGPGGHSIEVTDVITYRIDTTIFYWNSNITSVTPPACTTGKIVIISSKHGSIQSASLNFVQARSRNSTTAFRVNLTRGCEGALVSDAVTFPNGSYTYRLVGTDIDGVPFDYNTKRIVTYRQPDAGQFSFKRIESLAVEINTEEVTNIEYDFTNRGAYDTNFDFIVNPLEGLAAHIEPSSLLVAAGTTVKLQVLLRAIDCRTIKQSTVNVTAQLSCTEQQIQAPSRSITCQQPEFSFDAIGTLALEMDRDEIVKLEYNFTNRGAYNKTFNFSVNTPEGFATRIDPSSSLVAAGTTIKLQVLLRVIHSSIKRGTLHTVNVMMSTISTGQQISIQAPTRSLFIREIPHYIEDCGDCDGVCLKITYLKVNFKRCHGSTDHLPRPLCPPGMENVDKLKVVYFMEGAHFATFDPPPACTFGRVGLALSDTTVTNVKLVSVSIGHSYFHSYNLTMEKFCNGSYLVPAGSIMGNFPIGEMIYFFEYKIKYNSRMYNVSKRVNFIKQMSEVKPELYLSENGTADIGTSDNIKISFRLSNPTSFGTNFTLSGSFQIANGLQIENLLNSVIVYPQETVEIDATIKASTATAGARNVFTLNATNDCWDLSAQRNITVVEQSTGSHVAQTEAPTPADECGGCQNGGTCTVRVRRGRIIRRCRCTPGFRGSYCQVAS